MEFSCLIELRNSVLLLLKINFFTRDGELRIYTEKVVTKRAYFNTNKKIQSKRNVHNTFKYEIVNYKYI